MISRIARSALLAALAASLPIAAMADDHDHWRGERGDHRDMRRFHEHDLHHWNSGHWIRSEHNGRLGWWWVVGAAAETALWYSYAAPVYPYPDPYVPAQTVVVQAPAPAYQAPPAPPAPVSVWYFCASSGKYYPYVPTCPEGWKTVAATPPGQ